MPIRKRVVVAVAVVAVLLAATPATANPGADQERPQRIVWNGSFEMFGEEPSWCPEGFVPVHIVGTGTASHMGAVGVETWHCSNLDSGEFMLGVEVTTAANGDELHGTYSGQLTPITETEWTCDSSAAPRVRSVQARPLSLSRRRSEACWAARSWGPFPTTPRTAATEGEDLPTREAPLLGASPRRSLVAQANSHNIGHSLSATANRGRHWDRSDGQPPAVSPAV
jgi:hypothetical protein